jgi:hypothetical protein
MPWSDPYPDWPDHPSWSWLLSHAPTPELAAILLAARCIGATCVYDAITDRRIIQEPTDCQDQTAYQEILRPHYLLPHASDLAQLLQDLHTHFESRAQAIRPP